MNNSTPKPKVFVIVVTFNGEKWINQCVDSLNASIYPIDIVIVDNCSTDNTLDIVKNKQNIHVIRENNNNGFGIANNKGISFAMKKGADYIFLLNQDAFINEQSIQNLVNAAEIDKSYGLYSPIHLNEFGDNFDGNFLKNYIIDSAPQYLSDLCIKGQAKQIYPIYSVNAAAWFIPRSTFEIAGGFDPIFFMYGEDNDFSNRLEYHGIKRAIVTNSFVNHSRGKNTPKNTSFIFSVVSRAKRIRSNTLAKIKNPNKKLSTNTLSCFVNLLFASLNELIYCLRFREFLSHILAIIYLTLEVKKIARHRNICMTEKQPWISESQ